VYETTAGPETLPMALLVGATHLRVKESDPQELVLPEACKKLGARGQILG